MDQASLIGYSWGGKGILSIKPQDNNVHIWHIVLYDEMCEYEIYCMCYFQVSNDTEPTIIIKCCTPNSYIPVKGNLCLSYLAPLLEQGSSWLLFYSRLRSMFFDSVEHQESGELMKTWNRVVCKEFRWHFPALCEQYNVTQRGLKYVDEVFVKENFNQGFKFRLEDRGKQKDLIACDNSGRGNSGGNSEEVYHIRAVKRQRLLGKQILRINEIEDGDLRRK